MAIKNPTAEQEALSAVMRGGTEVRSAVKDRLAPDFFHEYEGLAHVIFDLLDDGQRPDPSTVKGRYEDDAVESVLQRRVTPRNILEEDGAISRVRSAFRATQGLLAVQSAEDSLVEGESPRDVQRSLEDDLRTLDDRLETGGSIQIGSVVDGSLNRVLDPLEEQPGLAPPLGMDEVFRVKEEDVILVGGRTSQGKTALVLSWVVQWTLHDGVPGLCFTIEGSAEEMAERLLSMDGRVDTQGEIEEEDRERLQRVAQRLRDSPLYIDDSASLDVAQIRARVRRLAHEEGIEYVVVDYLQLLSPDPAEDYEKKSDRITGMVRNLKRLARDVGVPIIITSQINRGVEQRDPPVPRLADLREGGEEPADKVMVLFRPEHYGIAQFRDYADAVNRGWVHLAKHRTGPTHEWWLSFIKRYALWGEPSLRDEETPEMEEDEDFPF